MIKKWSSKRGILINMKIIFSKATKRSIILLIITAIIIISVGCIETKENSETYTGELKPLKLSKEEEKLIKATGTQKFLGFEYYLDINKEKEDYRVEYLVENYHKGILQPKIFNGSTNITGSTGQIVFSTQNIGQEEERWVLSVINDNSTSTLSQNIDQPKLNMGETWKPLSSNKEIELDQPITLGVIARDSGDGILGITEEVFNDAEQALEELLTNDYVYLIKIIFTKVEK